MSVVSPFLSDPGMLCVDTGITQNLHSPLLTIRLQVQVESTLLPCPSGSCFSLNPPVPSSQMSLVLCLCSFYSDCFGMLKPSTSSPRRFPRSSSPNRVTCVF